MAYVHRSIVVPAAQAVLARSLCEQLAGPPGSGMFTTGVSPTGQAPATHFISAGCIEPAFAALLADAALLAATCAGAGIKVTAAQCAALLASASITTEQPFAALTRMGLAVIEVAPA